MLLARAARSTPFGLGAAGRPRPGGTRRVLPLVAGSVGPDPGLGPRGRRRPAALLVVREPGGPLFAVGVSPGDLACTPTGHVPPLLRLTRQWIVVVGTRVRRRSRKPSWNPGRSCLSWTAVGRRSPAPVRWRPRCTPVGPTRDAPRLPVTGRAPGDPGARDGAPIATDGSRRARVGPISDRARYGRDDRVRRALRPHPSAAPTGDERATRSTGAGSARTRARTGSVAGPSIWPAARAPGRTGPFLLLFVFFAPSTRAARRAALPRQRVGERPNFLASVPLPAPPCRSGLPNGARASCGAATGARSGTRPADRPELSTDRPADPPERLWDPPDLPFPPRESPLGPRRGGATIRPGGISRHRGSLGEQSASTPRSPVQPRTPDPSGGAVEARRSTITRATTMAPIIGSAKPTVSPPR